MGLTPKGVVMTSTATRRSQQTIRTIAVVALLAIGLGLAMQIAVVAVKLIGGSGLPGITLMADLVQSITWSVVICVGVSIATAVSKGRKALAGLLGAAFAPLGIATAKAAQKATLEMLSALEQPSLLPFLTLGTLRAVQYGLLAWILTTLAEKEIRRPSPYLLAGLIIGLVGGGVVTGLTQLAATAERVSLGLPQFAGTLVSEIGSPLGCAFVILIGQILPQHIKTYSASLPTKAASPN